MHIRLLNILLQANLLCASPTHSGTQAGGSIPHLVNLPPPPPSARTYVLNLVCLRGACSNLRVGGFVGYEETGSLAADGDREKRDSWSAALRRNHRHVAHTTPVTRFVPFSVEISGNWGPAARRFHKEALAHVNNAFDIENFH